MTITQQDNRLTFTEPDGVARGYVANGKTEKHQFTNGTIETKTTWAGPALRMEIAFGDGPQTIRTFTLRNTNQLEVSTALEDAPKDAKWIAVYDKSVQ